MPEEAFALTESPDMKPLPACKEETCHLCGLPVGNSGIDQVTGKKVHRFCCPGCRQVYLILSGGSEVLPAGFRETELYRACVQAKIIPGNADGPYPGIPVTTAERPGTDAPPIESGTPALDLILRCKGYVVSCLRLAC